VRRSSQGTWVLVAAAAVLAGASVILARLWLAGAVASGVVAAAAIIAGVWASRGASALQAVDGERRALSRVIWTRAGRLPLAGDLMDPVALGVHPAAVSGPGGRFPPFIPRQHTGELARALRLDHFVLLVGESTAGKSRAAYELIRAELPGHRVVQPAGREAAMAAARRAAVTTRSILWLDDLERFLGSGGLNGPAVRAVLDAGGTRYVVATMRSEEYAKFSGRTTTGLDSAGRDALRQGWDVLRLATRIDVPRMWSAQEIAQASQVPADARLDEAIRHAGEYGIAEYLAAAPQLLAEWRCAWAPGTHPRAAALVMAAVDARRAGMHRPLPLATLMEMHTAYLQRRGGERLRPEDPQAAIAWATTPLFATSSLLIPADGGYLAFDYLIDAVEQERLPATTLEILIRVATPGEALDIGQLAESWSLVSQADAAFRHAEAGGLFSATVSRSYLIANRHGTAAALHFARQAAEWTTAVSGPDCSQALEARGLVAWHTGHHGDPAAALRLFEDLVSCSLQLLGPDHEVCLALRRGTAAMTGNLGDHISAFQQAEALAADCAGILGEDHKSTIAARNQTATEVSAAGDPGRAASMLRALISDMTGRFGSRGSDVFMSRVQRAGCLDQAGDYQSAATEWERLAAEAAATGGRLRDIALYVRMQLAWSVGAAGDPAHAIRLLEVLLSEISALDDPQLTEVVYAHRSLAWWTGEAGDPATAERQLTALARETAAHRGTDDWRVIVLRLMASHWAAMTGSPDTALDRLQRNHEQLIANLGPCHEITQASRRELLRQQAKAIERPP
jgi:hypothetical protein